MTPGRRVGPERPRAPRGAEGVFAGDARRIVGAIAAHDGRVVEVDGDHYPLSPGPARGAVADRIEAWAQKHVI